QPMASSSTTFNACMPFSKSCGRFSIKWPDGWPNPSSPILHYCLTAEFEVIGVEHEEQRPCCDLPGLGVACHLLHCPCRPSPPPPPPPQPRYVLGADL
ncbi:hypothetical protein B296_00055536, partial [Ensete ventricosum]